MNLAKFYRTILILGGILVLLSCSDKTDHSLPHQKMHDFNSKVEQSLLSEYDALLLPGTDSKIFQEHLNNLFASSIVIDSTILECKKFMDGYRLLAESKSDFGEKILLNLECTKEQFDKYSKFKCQSAFIALSVEKVNREDILAEIDSLSTNKSIIDMGTQIMLVGKCLDLVETPTIYFYSQSDVS